MGTGSGYLAEPARGRRQVRRVVRFLDDGVDPDAEQARDERFEFGLDCVLEGIAAKVAACRVAWQRNGRCAGPGRAGRTEA